MEVTERRHGEERLMPLEEFYYLCFPRARGMSHPGGPHGEAPRRQGGAKGRHRPPFLLCCLHKSRQGRGNSLVLSALSDVCRSLGCKGGLWLSGTWLSESGALGDSRQEKYGRDVGALDQEGG